MQESATSLILVTRETMRVGVAHFQLPTFDCQVATVQSEICNRKSEIVLLQPALFLDLNIQPANLLI